MLPGTEEVDLELLAHFVRRHVVDAQLDEAGTGLDARLGEMPQLGLGHAAGLDHAVGDLQAAVAHSKVPARELKALAETLVRAGTHAGSTASR